MKVAGKRASASVVNLGPKQVVLGQNRTPKPGDQETPLISIILRRNPESFFPRN